MENDITNKQLTELNQDLRIAYFLKCLEQITGLKVEKWTINNNQLSLNFGSFNISFYSVFQMYSPLTKFAEYENDLLKLTYYAIFEQDQRIYLFKKTKLDLVKKLNIREWSRKITRNIPSIPIITARSTNTEIIKYINASLKERYANSPAIRFEDLPSPYDIGGFQL